MTDEQYNIYVHFPFCETKCHYCDFFSLPEKKFNLTERSTIFESILKEVDSFKDQIGRVQTLFLGGGTPSLVPHHYLEALIKKFRFENAAEITLEANPSSTTIEATKGWQAIGVTRLSFGIQALNDERLHWLGRVHSRKQAFSALEAAFDAGFKRVNADYIVGVPEQSEYTIEIELSQLLTQFPQIDHVSAYLLTLHPSNPKYANLPNEDEQYRQLKLTSQILQSFGFEHYEVSNFARPGGRAQHNENYWLGGSYLGIGPSAHSYWKTPQRRTKNWASLHKYSELIENGNSPIEWEEVMNTEQQRLETLMLSLRRAEGLDLKEYQLHFNDNLYMRCKHWLKKWEQLNLIKLRLDGFEIPQRIQVTSDGFFLLDQLVRDLA